MNKYIPLIEMDIDLLAEIVSEQGWSTSREQLPLEKDGTQHMVIRMTHGELKLRLVINIRAVRAQAYPNTTIGVEWSLLDKVGWFAVAPTTDMPRLADSILLAVTLSPARSHDSPAYIAVWGRPVPWPLHYWPRSRYDEAVLYALDETNYMTTPVEIVDSCLDGALRQYR